MVSNNNLATDFWFGRSRIDFYHVQVEKSKFIKFKKIMIFGLFWPVTSQNIFNFSRIRLIFCGNTYDMVSNNNLATDFWFGRSRIDFYHVQVEKSKFIKFKKIMIFGLFWPVTSQNIFNFSRIRLIFWGNTFDMVSNKNLRTDF